MNIQPHILQRIQDELDTTRSLLRDILLINRDGDPAVRRSFVCIHRAQADLEAVKQAGTQEKSCPASS